MDKIRVSEVEALVWQQDADFFNCGLFNSVEWVGSIAHDVYKTIFLNFYLNEEVVAKISGMVIDNGRLKGRQLYFVSGPALVNWKTEIFLGALEALYEFAKSNRYSRIQIRPFDQHLEELAPAKNYFHLENTEFLVDYVSHPEGIKFSSNFMRNVAKAKKSGAQFHQSRSHDVLRKMLELIEATRQTRIKKYGKDYKPMYMLNMNEQTLASLLDSGIGMLNYTELNGSINSVLFSLEKNRKQYFLLLGSDDIAYQHGLPSLIAYSVSSIARSKGFRYYNLGLVPREEEGAAGLIRHKEAQGGIAFVSYGYYTYFIGFPFNLLNPLMKYSKRLPENKFLNKLRTLFGKIFNV